MSSVTSDTNLLQSRRGPTSTAARHKLTEPTANSAMRLLQKFAERHARRVVPPNKFAAEGPRPRIASTHNAPLWLTRRLPLRPWYHAAILADGLLSDP